MAKYLLNATNANKCQRLSNVMNADKYLISIMSLDYAPLVIIYYTIKLILFI